MIIQLRGTSGSGKSTVVRNIMALYGPRTRVMGKERKQPLGYLLQRSLLQKRGAPLAVIGHYETACGGCDTIKTAREVYDAVKSAHENGFDVLFEGLLISGDINYTSELCGSMPVGSYGTAFVNTPIDLCIDSINMRRQAKGKEEPVARKNTESKFKAMVNVEKRLREGWSHVFDIFNGDRSEVLSWAVEKFDAKHLER